jgi:hypothetical protein
MVRSIVVLAACAAMAGGCASRAGAVQALAVPASDYAGLTCEKAAAELQVQQAKVADLSGRQNRRAVADSVGVFFAFIPVGTMVGGRVEDQLAQAKGEAAALQRHMVTRGCAQRGS